MSIIDGGNFKCSQHEQPFETADPQEWEEHVAKDHTDSGTSICAICGKETSFSHKPKHLKPMCEDCREAYSK